MTYNFKTENFSDYTNHTINQTQQSVMTIGRKIPTTHYGL